MSSGARAAPGAIAFFGGMTKVVGRPPGVEGGRLSYLLSNAVDQEQGNTIVKD
jgi:hypothetical protein